MAEAASKLLRDFFTERREAARARRAERQGLIPTGEASHLDES
jgi:tRNA(adenine34) deaminase